MKKTIVFLPLLLICCCKSSNNWNYEEKVCLSDGYPLELESFNFSFNWGINGDCYYNSSSKLLSKSYHSKEEKYNTTLELDDEQKEFIFKSVKDLKLDTFCDDYDYCATDNKTQTFIEPHNIYILEVSSEKCHKKLTVNASCGTNNINERNTKVYYTFQTLINFLESTNEWKSLPELDFAYL